MKDVSVRLAGLALGLAIVIIACGGVEDDNTGGGPIPQQFRGETYPGPRIELSGEVVLAQNGCFMLAREETLEMIVWPAGSESAGAEVVLPGGERVDAGRTISGSGTVLPVSQLFGFPDGYWGSTVGFCDTDAQTVVVFDTVSTEAG